MLHYNNTMTHKKRTTALVLLAIMLAAFAAGCSNKGIHMPKHRKRRHCNCPTFAQYTQENPDKCDGPTFD